MRILSNLSVSGLLGLNSVADANTDTDKFLVLDSSGIVRYRTGAELYSDIGAGGAAAYTSVLQHTVKAGVALTKGQAVYVTSADGTNMIVGKASNTSEATSSKTLGLVVQDLALNAQGFVITEGLLAGLDTSTANAGDPVWLGTDGNLIFGLANKPYAPAHLVFIGIVTRVQQNNGEIFVKVQNGFELQELHNVQITSTPSDNTVLAYEASTSLYKMKSIPVLLGYTPADTARTLTINGTSYDLSANRTWNVGTVTGSGSMGYVPKWATSSGLTNGMMYDAGTAVLIGTQTASSGKFMVYSTSPDNHYQAAGSAPSFRFADTIVSPSYTGIVGLATASNHFLIGAVAGDMVLANNTSSVGNFLFGTGATERMRINANGTVSIGGTGNTYKLEVTGTTKISGQLTLGSTITNGTYTYTLPSATGTIALVGGAGVGTVTSIATTGPITGGTITSTGTIGITQSGAASDGYLSSTDWNTFNNKQAALTNPVTGTGTTNYLPKFTGTSTIGNSLLIDQGSYVESTANMVISNASTYRGLSITTTTASARPTLSFVNSNYAQYGSYIQDINGRLAFGRMNYDFGGHSEGMTLNASGNLSIGNTNDTYKLDVSGTGRFTGRVQADGYATLPSTGSLISMGFSGGTGYLQSWSSNTLAPISIDGSTFAVRVNGFATTALSINGAGAATFSSSVTLTTSDSRLLGGNAVGRLIVSNSDTSTYLALYGSSNGNSIGLVTNSFISFNTGVSYSEAMRLNASGNLSIGNTNDTYKLDVSGTGRFSNNVLIEANQASSPLFYAKQTGTSGYTAIQFSGNNGTDIGALTTYNGQIYFGSWNGGNGSLGQLQINKTTGAATFSSSVTAGGNILVPAGSGLAWSGDVSRIMTPEDNVSGALIQTPGIIRFNAGGSEKVRITSGGNVGIGTTVVTAPLTVAGTTDLAWSASTSKLQISRSGTVARLQNYDNGSASSLSLQWDGGNVGIGTTSPAGRLTVVGPNSAGISIDQGNYNYYGAYNHVFSSSGYGTEYMRITNSGELLINTTTGGYKLNVNGNGYFNTTLYVNGAATFNSSVTAGTFNSYQADNAYSFYTSNAWGGWARNAFTIANGSGTVLASFGGYGGDGTSLAYSYIGTSYSNYIVAFNSNKVVNFASSVTAGGYLANGSTTITSPIDTGSTKAYFDASSISGPALTLRADSVGRTIRLTSDGSGSTIGAIDTNTTGLSIGTNTYHPIVFNPNATERMRITSTGELCINATSTIASAKLYVNGIGAFGGVYVGALGTGLVYSNGGTLTSTNPSDQRLKNTIKPLSYGLNEILQLNPKTFYYNDDVNKERLKYGFIAQEVKGIMPELARKLNAETDYLGLETEGIYVALVNAIKELKQELDILKNK